MVWPVNIAGIVYVIKNAATMAEILLAVHPLGLL
jgi:hypothetical protein